MSFNKVGDKRPVRPCRRFEISVSGLPEVPGGINPPSRPSELSPPEPPPEEPEDEPGLADREPLADGLVDGLPAGVCRGIVVAV